MSLSSSQLDAFFEVARTRNFSKAAKNLHLTQPAFSQRILNLERSMGVSLLVRDPSGVRLTEAGNKLLRYCQTKAALEKEALGTILPSGTKELEGEIRIGGYSSIFRSIVMPALNTLIRPNSRVRVQSFVRQMRELPGLLRSCEADFILLDHKLDRLGVENHLLGYETYVLAESGAANERGDIFLDHDPEDRTTELFFKRQGQASAHLERSFMNDIYGLIAGVEYGWGKAVLPRHLIQDNRRLRIVRTKKELKVPVFLAYHVQPFYTDLHKQVIETLVSRCGERLQ
jgi:DNA-binding transcriptional LysR family regulator